MFKYGVGLAAIFLAVCAAWFSVSGIAQLFIGAPTAAIAMASSLEFAKIVGVSFLYRHWAVIARPLRYYMTIGSVILMLITSIGIYGYLSAAYASAAVGYKSQLAVTQQVQTQMDGIDRSIERYEQRLAQFITIRNQQEQRLNELVGKTGFITQQRIVTQAETDIRNIQQQIDKLQVKKDSLENLKITQEAELNTSEKLGTFNYIAQNLGVPLDTVVKWFILVIVFVFDPMSLALVMSFNALQKLGKSSSEIIEEQKGNVSDITQKSLHLENKEPIKSENKIESIDEKWESPKPAEVILEKIRTQEAETHWKHNSDGSISP